MTISFGIAKFFGKKEQAGSKNEEIIIQEKEINKELDNLNHLQNILASKAEEFQVMRILSR